MPQADDAAERGADFPADVHPYAAAHSHLRPDPYADNDPTADNLGSTHFASGLLAQMRRQVGALRVVRGGKWRLRGRDVLPKEL